MIDQRSVSSPQSTGAAGVYFEQHVAAFFLGLLLVRGIPPILKGCCLDALHLQSRHFGWHTDDLLIVATDTGGGTRHLAAQVKRGFVVSDSDEECRKAFAGFWNDFKHNPQFHQESDALALVALRGTDTLLSGLTALLDCARASLDGADFLRRSQIDGLLSKKSRAQLGAIRTIVAEIEGATPADDALWSFLRALHVMSLDLNTPTAQGEAWIKVLLSHASTELDPVAAADGTWRELLELIGNGMPAAASYTRDTLPESLRRRHGNLPSTDLVGLVAHSKTVLNGIRA